MTDHAHRYHADRTQQILQYTILATDLLPNYGYDALVTNFHLPKTSLLIMTCAFAGYELTMEAYKKAIKDKYRFFSYGDAMLVI